MIKIYIYIYIYKEHALIPFCPLQTSDFQLHVDMLVSIGGKHSKMSLGLGLGSCPSPGPHPDLSQTWLTNPKRGRHVFQVGKTNRDTTGRCPSFTPSVHSKTARFRKFLRFQRSEDRERGSLFSPDSSNVASKLIAMASNLRDACALQTCKFCQEMCQVSFFACPL